MHGKFMVGHFDLSQHSRFVLEGAEMGAYSWGVSYDCLKGKWRGGDDQVLEGLENVSKGVDKGSISCLYAPKCSKTTAL